jgi:hypothetical protein
MTIENEILEAAHIRITGGAAEIEASIERTEQDDGNVDASMLESVIHISLRVPLGLIDFQLDDGVLKMRAPDGCEQEARVLLTALHATALAGLSMLDKPSRSGVRSSTVDIIDDWIPESSRIALLRRSRIMSVKTESPEQGVE